MKKSIAFAMALCLAFSSASIVLAANPAEQEVDFMNYEFPEDAIILYQGVDGVIYQSKEKSAEISSADMLSDISAREMTYESTWIDKNQYKHGSFTIKPPHPWIWSTTNGTLKIQSEDPDVSVEIILTGGITDYFHKIIRPADGDVHVEFSSPAGEMAIVYSVLKASRNHGLRIMCWLW